MIENHQATMFIVDPCGKLDKIFDGVEFVIGIVHRGAISLK